MIGWRTVGSRVLARRPSSLALALALLAACPRDRQASSLNGVCKTDEDCRSGLVCVHGLASTPVCLQQCGERGYGACPAGWTCAGVATAVDWRRRRTHFDDRQVCVRAEREVREHPTGWWIVAAVEPPSREADVAPGAALHLADDGYAFVSPDGALDRRQSIWEQRAGIWYLVGRHRLRFDAAGKTDLVMSAGEQQLLLTPAPRERIEALDERLRAAGDPIESCRRASTCCQEAAKLLDEECDLQREIGDGRFLRQCEATLEGYRVVLAQRGLALPASCAPAGEAQAGSSGAADAGAGDPRP